MSGINLPLDLEAFLAPDGLDVPTVPIVRGKRTRRAAARPLQQHAPAAGRPAAARSTFMEAGVRDRAHGRFRTEGS